MGASNGEPTDALGTEQDIDQGEGAEVAASLSEEDVQKLTALGALIEQVKTDARKVAESKLQSAKDREVGKVLRDKRSLEADLKAAQAGQGYIVELLTRGLEGPQKEAVLRGMADTVTRARVEAGQLPVDEQSKVTEAQMIAVELRRKGVAVDMNNPSVSDPRLDFTLPSTFIASAQEILNAAVSPTTQVAPTKQAVAPPPVEEGARVQKTSSNDKLRSDYAMGLVSTEQYMKTCAARGITP